MTVLAWLCLFLAAGPLLLGAMNLRLYRRPEPAAGQPSVSVLIPARNEEANIAEACAAVLANRDVDLDLVVLDDHSTDRTAAILRGIDDPRLRVAEAPDLPPGWSGKQHACMHLARLARHETMVFVDADVRLTPDALSRIAGFLQRHDVGLASGFPHQRTETWGERLLLPLIHFLLLGYLPMRIMQRLSAPSLGAGCGQLIAVRRAAYERAGGHAAIRESWHDGVTLPRAFRRAGCMTGLFDADRLAVCRMYGSAAEVWHGLMKNATEGMARPVALPVWTVILGFGQVLPLPLFLVAPSVPAALAVAASLGLRLVIAWRFRQSWISACLHPIGVAVLLALQWTALLRAAQGRPTTWRGRTSPAA
ncbi:MAG: glycosyltransferase family 2 protein [Acetobacteraceae bacterium]